MQLQQNNLLNVFHKFPANISRLYQGWFLVWQILAVALTWFIVRQGWDWSYFVWAHHSPLFGFMFSAAAVGFLLPVLLPVFLLIWGGLKNSWQILNSAYALAQAAFLGWLVSSFYKFFTGRPGLPGRLSTAIANLHDISHVFKFGLGRGGVFFGWPSSHATVACAVGFCLYQLFPDNRLIRILGVLFALYITLGVSMTIHWLSDAAAGAIFGTLIGLSVGRSFYQRSRRLH